VSWNPGRVTIKWLLLRWVTGKPSRYITNHQGQLSLPYVCMGYIYRALLCLAEVMYGQSTCVWWQVTLRDLIWQVTLRSFAIGFAQRAIPYTTFNVYHNNKYARQCSRPVVAHVQATTNIVLIHCDILVTRVTRRIRVKYLLQTSNTDHSVALF